MVTALGSEALTVTQHSLRSSHEQAAMDLTGNFEEVISEGYSGRVTLTLLSLDIPHARSSRAVYRG